MGYHRCGGLGSKNQRVKRWSRVQGVASFRPFQDFAYRCRERRDGRQDFFRGGVAEIMSTSQPTDGLRLNQALQLTEPK
jgi:hypothetical protein